MSDLGVQIEGTKGKDSSITRAHVHPFKTAGGHTHHGLVVLAHPFLETEPTTKFFQNPTKGIAMNQAVTFGGTRLNATVLHAGVNSGSAIAGTTDVASPSAFELDDVAGGFDAAVGPGALVHNTALNTYARVLTVNSDTNLTLDTDIMQAGNETFVINDIWPGTAVQGTWNFADGGKITITSANNDDEATFTVDAAHIWEAEHFVSFTGKVDLDTYNPSNNNIRLEFGLDGVLVGNSINLDDFIDTGDFGAQQFSIPIGDLVVATQLMNGIRITVVRSGGAKPAFTLDDVRLEVTGTPLVFEVPVDVGDRFHISELVFTYADALVSEKTGLSGDTEAFTNDFLTFDAILGVSALTNGFVITRSKGGEILFSATIRTLGAHIAAGATIGELFTDDANTFLTLRVLFSDPLVLTGDVDDKLTVTINDKMDGLLRFTAAARGSLETS